jgi:tRNA(Ile)-lysidine synthase
VATLAVQRGVDCHIHDVEVTEGANLEARARAARRAVLPEGALTGHTMDDLAETMLLNLIRGAGIDGLSSMVDDPTKPILSLRRRDVAALVREAGIEPRIDSTNEDTSLRRNDIRARLVPLLADLAERDIVPVLARQATVIAEDRAWLDQLTDTDTRVLEEINCRELQSWPTAKLRRWLRRELRRDDADGWHAPSADEIARASRVVLGEVVATDLAGGRHLRRSGQHLSLAQLPLQP